jgi:hypothetical protein
MESVMSMLQPDSPEIAAAGKAQRNWFWIYAGLLFLMAIVIVLGRLAANKYQDLLKADANRSIAQALEGAAKANERTEKLENQNLLLQTDLTKLQIEQAETHARVQETRRKLDPRVFSDPGKAAFMRKLGETKGALDILFVGDSKSEARDFANAVARGSKQAGWTANSVGQIAPAELDLLTRDLLIKRSIENIGLVLIVERRPPFETGRAAEFLREALALGGGFFVPICRTDERAGKPPLLLVGPKRLRS